MVLLRPDRVVCCSCHQSFKVPVEKLELALSRRCPKCAEPLIAEIGEPLPAPMPELKSAASIQDDQRQDEKQAESRWSKVEKANVALSGIAIVAFAVSLVVSLIFAVRITAGVRPSFEAADRERAIVETPTETQTADSPSFLPNPLSALPSTPTPTAPPLPSPTTTPPITPTLTSEAGGSLGSALVGFRQGDTYEYEIDLAIPDYVEPGKLHRHAFTLNLLVTDRNASSNVLTRLGEPGPHFKIMSRFTPMRRTDPLDLNSPLENLPDASAVREPFMVSGFGVVDFDKYRNVGQVSRLLTTAGLGDPILVACLPLPRRATNSWVSFTGAKGDLASRVAIESGFDPRDVRSPSMKYLTMEVDRSIYRVVSETETELVIERKTFTEGDFKIAQMFGVAIYKFSKTLGVVTQIDYRGSVHLPGRSEGTASDIELKVKLVSP